MLPKIEFRYSYIYDDVYRHSVEIKEFLKRADKKYPSPYEIIKFLDGLRNAWKNQGERILKTINKVSGLKWSDKTMVCYVVGFCRPMSDPLTIKFCKDIDHTIDILTHELIHNIQLSVDNKKWNKWLKYLDFNYRNESKTTKDHILLNAFHTEIYLKLFDSERLERDIENSHISPDYLKSWKIVEKEGHEKIINKFKKVIGN
ncbi:MAG: hypothetical protein AABW89_06100 [Nanoarchaeota archaeon]